MAQQNGLTEGVDDAKSSATVQITAITAAGVTLPFLSFGGSSMVVTLGAMGVLMNIARQGH